jgi:hypothetical protein
VTQNTEFNSSQTEAENISPKMHKSSGNYSYMKCIHERNMRERVYKEELPPLSLSLWETSFTIIFFTSQSGFSQKYFPGF